MEKIRLYANLERTIAHHEETQAALYKHARVMASASQARLAQHRRTGSHYVDISHGKVDFFVNLRTRAARKKSRSAGPSAMSIEMGWHDKRTGKFHQGLRILRGVF